MYMSIDFSANVYNYVGVDLIIIYICAKPINYLPFEGLANLNQNEIKTYLDFFHKYVYYAYK